MKKKYDKSIGIENPIVEVFKTNVDNTQAAFKISTMLEASFPGCNINFDLDDCDRILRIETQHAIDTDEIIALGHQLGVVIDILED